MTIVLRGTGAGWQKWHDFWCRSEPNCGGGYRRGGGGGGGEEVVLVTMP